MARGKRIRNAGKKAGSLFGIKGFSDLAKVVVTSAGSNYFANQATRIFNVQNQWIRPVVASLVAWSISNRSNRNINVLGALVLSLAQAGIISSLNLGSLTGSSNPARGQSSINQLNVLGRLP
tara:strand:- start:401 stop:766 length:366 start_codon:yes stop_codon:yes gene_type:complete